LLAPLGLQEVAASSCTSIYYGATLVSSYILKIFFCKKVKKYKIYGVENQIRAL